MGELSLFSTGLSIFGDTIGGVKVTNDGTVTTFLGIAGDYVRIGDATTSALCSTNDDLLVTRYLGVGTILFPEDVHMGHASYGGKIQCRGYGHTNIDFTPTDLILEGTQNIVLGAGDGYGFNFINTAIVGMKIHVAKVTKAHDSDLFDAAALTDSVVIWQQPAGTILVAVKIRMATQFAATSMTDLDVTIGDVGDDNGILAATMNLTLDTNLTEYTTKGAYLNAAAGNGSGMLIKDSATDWSAYATAVGANLSTTSAGSINFYFTYIEYA